MRATIREARAQDYEQLCMLTEKVDALHRERLPHTFQKPPGPIRDRDYISYLIDSEDVGLFVAELEGQLAGFVQIMLARSPDIPICVPRRYAVIDNLVVKSEFRRSGIGRALMDRASEWAATRGASSIELTVYNFNETALEFYRHLGYEMLRHTMSKKLG
jgi:ribosomal protein S18 acetylase RimI-like enzyme